MGSAIGKRLREAGHDVHVWNRTRSKAEALEPAGATVAATPLDAAGGAELLVSMLADDDAVRESLLGGDAPAIGGLDPGRTHVSMSTISPALSERLAEAHAERGQHYVAAPVMGRPDAAARGGLVVLAAGSSEAIDGCAPLFEAIGQATEVLGEEPSRANVVKLAVNFALVSILEVLGEAYALVERYGVPDDRFLDVVNGALLRSPVVAAYGERIARDTFEPAGFRLRLGLKDVRLALEAAEARTLAMPVASLVRDRFLAAMDLGLADVDWSAIARAARKKAA
jgi:3-hydroxyisobutyrate dehydrogenase-like beta-hydroxyacid dehydrogenase